MEIADNGRGEALSIIQVHVIYCPITQHSIILMGPYLPTGLVRGRGMGVRTDVRARTDRCAALDTHGPTASASRHLQAATSRTLVGCVRGLCSVEDLDDCL